MSKQSKTDIKSNKNIWPISNKNILQKYYIFLLFNLHMQVIKVNFGIILYLRIMYYDIQLIIYWMLFMVLIKCKKGLPVTSPNFAICSKQKTYLILSQCYR